MSFRLVPNSVTFDDLERRNSLNDRIISPNSVAFGRAVFVRFSLGGGSEFRLAIATIAGMEVAKLVPWNSLLN